MGCLRIVKRSKIRAPKPYVAEIRLAGSPHSKVLHTIDDSEKI